MINKTITKFAFTIGILVFWTTLSIGHNNHTLFKFPNYADLQLCKNDITTLNFFNTKMIDIGPDLISSPVITCVNFTNNNIRTIAKDTFTHLPNLTYLFLSNIYLTPEYKYILTFGDHKKLNVLVLNNIELRNGEKITITFGNYPNLEILSIRNSYLSDLRSEIVSDRNGYAQIVYNTNVFPKLKILDLSGNSIETSYYTFTNLLSNSLQFLDLHNNKLDYLILKEKGSNLFALNVDNNYLKYITYTTFYNKGLTLSYLKNLQYLSISNNDIHIIELNAFQDTNKLIYLNLSVNSINYLDSNIFVNLYSLNTLDLSFNQLNCVPKISNELNISILYLNSNKIENIISNNFAQLPKLTKLLLGGNKIDEIDSEAFDSLSALEELDLSRNKLSSLPEGWTASFTSLKYLDLSDNMFTSLESLSLTNALSLIDLYLAINSIEYLNIKYFKNLSQNLTIHWT